LVAALGGHTTEVPLPAALARFNRRATNVVTRRVAGWLPGFGVVTHRGRRSGIVYRTPVNVFRRPGGFTFALTYGQGDWVRNVLHAGTAELLTRRRAYALTAPVVARDPEHREVPFPVGLVLRLIHADEVLRAEVAGVAAGSTPPC
jgi:deazaflavin-dependent oxidoreductase (nitroreductase family)